MRNHAQLDTDKQRRDNRTDADAAQSVQKNQAGDERNDDHGHVKRDFDGRERLAGQRGDGQHSAFTGQRHNVRRNVEKDADCNENSGNPAHQQTDNQVVRRWKHRRERVAGGRECAEHHADRNLQQIFAFKAAAHQQHLQDDQNNVENDGRNAHLNAPDTGHGVWDGADRRHAEIGLDRQCNADSHDEEAAEVIQQPNTEFRAFHAYFIPF